MPQIQAFLYLAQICKDLYFSQNRAFYSFSALKALNAVVFCDAPGQRQGW